MSIRHGVYIQEEATAVQVPKTGNSSVQVVVGTAPVNMAENPSEAVNVPILANSGTEAMAALGYSVDFKNFTLCQTMFATSNLFQVSPVVYINVLDPAKHNKELAEAEYQVNQKQAVIEKEGIILEGLTVKNSTGDIELKAGERNCARLVISGANVGNGTDAGPFYRNCDNGTGNLNWSIGGRPLC